MEFLNTLKDVLSLDGIRFFMNELGFSGIWANIAIVIFLVWIINLLIILPLHRLSIKKIRNAKFDLTKSVDKIIYLLAKAQYSLSEKQTLQYDPCFALMKTMFNSGHFEYVDNIATIKENVQKVELLLHQTVITKKEWDTTDKEKSKLKLHQCLGKILGYELCIATLGIYKLFW